MSAEKLQYGILYLIALVLSICVHEWGHAIVADKLGDPTPRSQGRVTLNPLAHIDPIGTLLLPAMMVFTGIPLLGWGKPVFTNPNRYTRRMSMHRAGMLVAAAGPAMNFVFAAVLSVVWLVAFKLGVDGPLRGGLAQIILMNFSLMCFNLLPIPPLDGGTVLKGFLPRQHHHFLEPLERYGFIVLMLVVMTPQIMRGLMLPAAYITNAWFGALSWVATAIS